MGNHSGSIDNNYPSKQQFLEGWRPSYRTSAYTIYTDAAKPPNQIEEHTFLVRDQLRLERENLMFQLRKNARQVVAGHFLELQRIDNACSVFYKGSIYIERIKLRLSNVTKIPFPDILHVYSQVLKGFKKLTQLYGCFYISEDHICISRDETVKVWLNNDLHKSHPSMGSCTEDVMVHQIIDFIAKNTDVDSMPADNPFLVNYIYRNSDDIGFNLALAEVYTYASLYNNSLVPAKISCLRKINSDPPSIFSVPPQKSPLYHSAQQQLTTKSKYRQNTLQTEPNPRFPLKIADRKTIHYKNTERNERNERNEATRTVPSQSVLNKKQSLTKKEFKAPRGSVKKERNGPRGSVKRDKRDTAEVFSKQNYNKYRDYKINPVILKDLLNLIEE